MQHSKEKLFAHERKGQMYSLILENGKMTVSELADNFQVTPATVRNDLQELENMHLIIRTHGGAMIHPEKNIKEMEPDEKETLYFQEKQSIAQAALQYISDGDTLVLDTGTTTLELAKLLHLKKSVTVITNDLQIGLILQQSSHIQTHFLSGIIRHHFHYTLGSDELKAFSVDKAFIAANALDLHFGPSTPDVHLAKLKKQMVSVSDQSILLCDSSKLGKKAFKSFCAIEEIDVLITDNKINGILKGDFEDIGINVTIANPFGE
ncbi:DeoR family transcriptional regulator [Pullulanibacillus camelliae]|uniref:DeoR family transcriptional regulator n=1 Tax=Pullulanibacillus camelliae TaxID=1707096 RepID=A0A8J2VL19_9BACL|nr:DeoR/GlpR family DNA-binding transcription regulator [Pullulanibacillus camelliae]GGE27589.1 DeoR family transcriptional regulator [Pullulanibacillus camelliae]